MRCIPICSPIGCVSSRSLGSAPRSVCSPRSTGLSSPRSSAVASRWRTRSSRSGSPTLGPPSAARDGVHGHSSAARDDVHGHPSTARARMSGEPRTCARGPAGHDRAGRCRGARDGAVARPANLRCRAAYPRNPRSCRHAEGPQRGFCARAWEGGDARPTRTFPWWQTGAGLAPAPHTHNRASPLHTGGPR